MFFPEGYLSVKHVAWLFGQWALDGKLPARLGIDSENDALVMMGEKLANGSAVAYIQTVQGMFYRCPERIFRSIDAFTYLEKGEYPYDDLNPTAPILLHLENFIHCLGLKSIERDKDHQKTSSSQTKPRAVSERDLKEWYSQHVSESLSAGTQPTREESYKAANKHFEGQIEISHERIGGLRTGPLTPDAWHKRGRRPKKGKLE